MLETAIVEASVVPVGEWGKTPRLGEGYKRGESADRLPRYINKPPQVMSRK